MPHGLGLSYESVPFPVPALLGYGSLTNSHGLQICWYISHSYCMLLGVSFMCFGFIYLSSLWNLIWKNRPYLRHVVPVSEGESKRVSRNTRWLIELLLGMDLHHFCLDFIDQRRSKDHTWQWSRKWYSSTGRPHKSHGQEMDAYFSYEGGDIKFSGQKCKLLWEHTVGRGLRAWEPTSNNQHLIFKILCQN